MRRLAGDANADSTAPAPAPNATGPGSNWDGSRWIEKTLDVNETRLYGIWAWGGGGGGGGGGWIGASKMAPTCPGRAYLLTRAPPNATTNGACPEHIRPYASCTCLTNVQSKTAPNEWSFRLERRSGPLAELPPTELDVRTTETLAVSSISTIVVPTSIQSLSIVGVSKDERPINIPFVQGIRQKDAGLVMTEGRGGSTAAEVAVSKVSMTNFDLSTRAENDDFFPMSIKELSLRQCNINRMVLPFVAKLSALESLDLSYNQLEEPYIHLMGSNCADGRCALRSLNMSSNRLKSLPDVKFLVALNSLDLRGNDITNLTVHQELFDRISTLKSFMIDATSESGSCPGQVKEAHGIKFCVFDASSANAGGESNGSSVNEYLLYGVIGGCVVVAILLFMLVRQRGICGRRDDILKNEYEEYGGHTFAFDESTVSATTSSLINDPVIITNRIPYKDLRFATCINKGGFGLVYSGMYRRRRVAIKKIRPDRSGDISQIEAFLREICLMATLHHERIVEFIGVAWNSLRDLSAVTEYMDLGDLREVLQSYKLRNQRLQWSGHKTAIAMQIAEALAYLHSLSPRVIHRDLKSKNVLMNSRLDAKLSDFGISRERDIIETHMTAGIGTSFWIAPEVLLGRDYDERADIYSFGVVLCEIDTDDYPFWNAKNPAGDKVLEQAILHKVAAGTLRPEFSKECPDGILKIADMCLQSDPEDRPTAQQVFFLLGQTMRDSSMSSTSSISDVDE